MDGLLLMVIRVLFRMLFVLIFARAVLTWFRPRKFNRTFYEVERFLHQVTEPILGPIRRLLPMTGGIDLSPLVALLLLGVVESFLIMILH